MPPLNILLVEDNPADAYLTKLALQDNRLCKNLRVVEHGEQALSFLRQEGSYAGAFRPEPYYTRSQFAADGRIRGIKNTSKPIRPFAIFL